jgi:UPF0271 protein
MAQTRIDLNADLAEEAGDDAALLPFLSSANLSCGAHAGGPAVLAAALAACRAAGVTAGAHPGYPDRANFGRVVVPMTAAEVTSMVAGQVALACEAAAAAGTGIAYVKPHGALYNLAATDAGVAAAIAAGVAQVDRGLVLLGLAGSVMLAEGARAGLATAAEAFADRAYAPDGTLVPRGQPGAVLHDAATVAARALAMVQDGAVTAIDGSRIALQADSLCLHGDTPGALAMARATRAALDAAGIAVRPFA